MIKIFLRFELTCLMCFGHHDERFLHWEDHCDWVGSSQSVILEARNSFLLRAWWIILKLFSLNSNISYVSVINHSSSRACDMLVDCLVTWYMLSRELSLPLNSYCSAELDFACHSWAYVPTVCTFRYHVEQTMILPTISSVRFFGLLKSKLSWEPYMRCHHIKYVWSICIWLLYILKVLSWWFGAETRW